MMMIQKMSGCERYDREGNRKKERGKKKDLLGKKQKQFFLNAYNYKTYCDWIMGHMEEEWRNYIRCNVHNNCY